MPTWIKEELKLSGIDTNVFAACSCRSASISKTKVNEKGKIEIMKKGCWKSECTLKKVYDET